MSCLQSAWNSEFLSSSNKMMGFAVSYSAGAEERSGVLPSLCSKPLLLLSVLLRRMLASGLMAASGPSGPKWDSKFIWTQDRYAVSSLPSVVWQTFPDNIWKHCLGLWDFGPGDAFRRPCPSQCPRRPLPCAPDGLSGPNTLQIGRKRLDGLLLAESLS